MYIPKVTKIKPSTFWYCSSLGNVDFPNVSMISTNAFAGCNKLSNVSVPNVEILGNSVFYGCSTLPKISLPKCYSVGNYAFRSCYKLQSIYFRTSNMLSIISATFMSVGTQVTGGFKIYVPTSLVTYYQQLSGWSFYASRILPFDDWVD